jgi:DNA-binding ferritin-like protein
MILEATRRAIMMEERGEETDSKIRELISFLHNAQKPVREIHWNTNEYALHMVTDETIGDLCEWEDGLAEAFLGDRDIELKISDRKPSSDTDFKSIINELVGLASDVKESVSGNKDYDNVCAVLDEILETGNQLLYKSQLK